MEKQAASNSTTLERVHKLGLVAVVRTEFAEAAVEVSSALIEGGILGIEATFTTPKHTGPSMS